MHTVLKQRVMVLEIGSEFQSNSASVGKNEYVNLCDGSKRYVLSGRTGLHLIAKELKKQLSSILMPAYCCGSMVSPFISQGVSVSFYNFDDMNDLSINTSAEAVLIMDYFGFISEKTLTFASECKKAGKIIIIDATQTAFSMSKTYEMADYLVVSYRKWFDCLSAAVYSKNGFSIEESTVEHPSYNVTWRNASRLKEQYINAFSKDKQEYLSLYAKANRMLDEDYIGYGAAVEENERLNRVDSAFVRSVRRENANYLINEIKKLAASYKVGLLFDAVGKLDCPLFVPILVDGNNRNLIRNELINQNIYCPVHWPIDRRYPYQETLYHRTELSLICDQRYGLEEMKKQISVLTQVLARLD